jgi:hypothetical protein
LGVLSPLALMPAGCDRNGSGGAAGSNSPPDTAPVTTRASVATLYDGFEGEAVAKFWLPGDYGTGLYVPGDIHIANDPARSGAHSVEITVHEGDVEAAGDADTQVERAELDSGHFPLRGQEAWYGFSVFVPRNFPIVDNRLVISSCKQSDVSRPLTAQRFRNGRHTLTVESQGRKETFKLPDLPVGRWVDFVCRARYSAGKDGAFEMWMDGGKVASYAGPLADPQNKNAFYHKIGLYRDRMKQPMTIYFDNYAMGPSYDAVDPVRFEGNARAPHFTIGCFPGR